MRTPHISVCVATAAAAASLVLAPAAFAAGPGPNDGGTVKIHDSATDEVVGGKDPRVCGFFLDAFAFDGVERVAWQVVTMPSTDSKGTVAETGTLLLDGDGHGRTGDLAVADGHYTLEWHIVGRPGTGGQKAFRTDCDGLPEPGEGGAASPTGSGAAADPSASTEPGGTTSSGPPSGGESATASPSSPASSSSATPARPSAAEPSPNGGAGDDDLATTGSGTPVGAITTAAAILLGAGAYLALRHRNSRP